MNFIIRLLVNFSIEFLTWAIPFTIIGFLLSIFLKKHRKRIFYILLYTDLAIAGIQALASSIK